jgi:hypothetical protein
MRLVPVSRFLALAFALLALAVGTAGCGSKTVAVTSANGQVTTRTVPNVHFAKTKFVLHMGLAFGAFHRYVYKPYKAGAFRSGAQGRVKALLKAASGAVFAVHELKTARDDALSDSRLRALAEKVEGLLSKLTSLGGSLKGGVLHPAAIESAAAAVTSLGAASGGLGATIKEVAPTL